jgi:hypothetical protein
MKIKPEKTSDEQIVDNLKSAANRLGNAEIDMKAAQDDYGKALTAFNQRFAPQAKVG